LFFYAFRYLLSAGDIWITCTGTVSSILVIILPPYHSYIDLSTSLRPRAHANHSFGSLPDDHVSLLYACLSFSDFWLDSAPFLLGPCILQLCFPDPKLVFLPYPYPERLKPRWRRYAPFRFLSLFSQFIPLTLNRSRFFEIEVFFTPLSISLFFRPNRIRPL